MKRSILILFIMLAFVSLACDLGGITSAIGGKPSDTPEPTPNTLPSPTATARSLIPTSKPTDSIPTLPPPPAVTSEAAEVTAEPQSSSDYFRDDFDTESPDWQYQYISGNTQEQCEGPSFVDGSVRWGCPNGEEAQVRITNETYDYEDVVVQVEVENFGNNNNAIALLCRVSNDGWYEFRITSGGLYSIYRYDWALKDAGQNPYVYITDGASVNIITGAKVNKLAMSCVGDRFEFYANDVKIKVNIPLSLRPEFEKLKSGGVGFGMGVNFNSPSPVDIAFNWFETLAP